MPDKHIDYAFMYFGERKKQRLSLLALFGTRQIIFFTTTAEATKTWPFEYEQYKMLWQNYDWNMSKAHKKDVSGGCLPWTQTSLLFHTTAHLCTIKQMARDWCRKLVFHLRQTWSWLLFVSLPPLFRHVKKPWNYAHAIDRDEVIPLKVTSSDVVLEYSVLLDCCSESWNSILFLWSRLFNKLLRS